MKFDPTISLGNILTMILMLVAMVGAWIKLVVEVNEIKLKLGIVYQWWEQTTGAVIPPARRRQRSSEGD